jgi:hypothetical protein
VVKGCAQKKGFDYTETYAPVARLTTVRTLLSVINKKNLYAQQMDVKNAFLHGNIKEELYMKQPQGLSENPKLVCKLNKSLYGLKQAPRKWNFHSVSFVKGLMFKQSESDKCLYIYSNEKIVVYLLLYVDNFIIAGNNLQIMQSVKTELMKEFKMKDLGDLNYFLGIRIDQTKNGMVLSQSVYLKKLLARFQMESCKPVKTPLEVKPCREVKMLKIVLLS